MFSQAENGIHGTPCPVSFHIFKFCHLTVHIKIPLSEGLNYIDAINCVTMKVLTSYPGFMIRSREKWKGGICVKTSQG